MYIPRHFASDDENLALSIVRDNPFAVLMTMGEVPGAVPDISHLPMLWLADGDGRGKIIGHVAKANAHCQRFDGKATSMAVFSGPHAYISPNYYTNPALVPTWNYAAVHLHGKLSAVTDDVGAIAILDTLVAAFENDTTGNWSTARLPEGHLERQIKGIVAFEMPVDHIETKVKMSQNRSAEDIAGAISALTESAYQDDQKTARMMQALNGK